MVSGLFKGEKKRCVLATRSAQSIAALKSALE